MIQISTGRFCFSNGLFGAHFVKFCTFLAVIEHFYGAPYASQLAIADSVSSRFLEVRNFTKSDPRTHYN